MDFIVQCVMDSQKPRAHNQAFLLLSHCAIIQYKTLTFIMDKSHDYVFILPIKSTIIKSLIPTIVTKNNKDNADISLDFPEH